MRGLSTFLIASTLLALGLTAPTGGLEDRGLSILEDRADNPSTPSTPPRPSKPEVLPAVGKGSPKNPFPLDDFIKSWILNPRIRETLKYAAQFTKGGYEGWVQVEWDLAAKDFKTVKVQPSDREVSVYEGSTELADFVFEPTEGTKGVIVELKTENKGSKGAKFIDAVKKDIAKLKGKYKTKYDSKEYTKVAIAIAWSKNARAALGEIDEMTALEKTELELSGGEGPLQVYRLDVENDLNTAMANMNVGSDPAPKPASDPAPACNQKRDGQKCQSKTGSSNPTTGTKDKSGSASKNNKAGEAATAVQPAKSGKKKQASKPAKAGKKVKAGVRKSNMS